MKAQEHLDSTGYPVQLVKVGSDSVVMTTEGEWLHTFHGDRVVEEFTRGQIGDLMLLAYATGAADAADRATEKLRDLLR